ncbi:MAG: flavodoxin domain-containing protein [Lachnospiraceae bacterium]
MKTIIVYSSQTGFTQRYARWLSEELDAETISLADAKKKNRDYFEGADAIIYGGWAMGGKIVNVEWFAGNIPAWKGKKLALFCVGASPNDTPDVEASIQNALTSEEQKYAKAFYCQGGLSYEKMKFPYKLAMKAFASMMRNKKDANEQEKVMGEMISHSYDIADKKYIEPIMKYLRG